MIDLHCHQLPGIDDGPASVEDALALARAHVAAGISRVAATPHVTDDIPTSAEVVAREVARLNGVLAQEGVELEVLTGGEIDIARAGSLDDAELRGLALGGGPWLLLESPLRLDAGDIEGVVSDLVGRGHRVMLAHPERCPAFLRDPDRLAALVGDGVLTSVTASALVGRFGGTVERLARQLVDEGLVHNVASDAHSAVSRPPGLRAEIQEAGYTDRLAWWCEDLPAAVLAGEPVPADPVARRRRRPRTGRGAGRAKIQQTAPRAPAPPMSSPEPLTFSAIESFAAAARERALRLRADQELEGLDRTGEISIQLTALAKLAGRLEAQCAALAGGAPAAEPAPDAAAAAAPGPRARPAPVEPAAQRVPAGGLPDPRGTEPPQQVARQMAAAGASRTEIESYLRQHLERGEARRITRQLLGRGS